jgi:hypothetical protein
MYIHGLQKDESRIGYMWITVKKTSYIRGLPVR